MLPALAATAFFLGTAHAKGISQPALTDPNNQLSSAVKSDHGRDDNRQANDAEIYVRRGIIFSINKNFDAAIESFDRALEIKPGEPRYLYLRANALFRNHDNLAGTADLDEAIAREPNYVDARLARASLSIISDRGHSARADSDLAVVKRNLSNDDERHLRLADIYIRLRDWRSVIEQLDLWISSHPRSDHRSMALGNRCSARVIMGIELPKALGDCNAALRLEPSSSNALGNRATIYLRLGKLSAAIKNYNSALETKKGNVGWFLFGRGLARIRNGAESEGRADIAAALAINRSLPGFAKTIGIIQTVTDIR